MTIEYINIGRKSTEDPRSSTTTKYYSVTCQTCLEKPLGNTRFFGRFKALREAQGVAELHDTSFNSSHQIQVQGLVRDYLDD